jgi:hypothetical protein
LTKAFYIIGIIGAFLFISIFLGYAGLSYTGMSNFNLANGQTPDLPTNAVDAFVHGLGFIFGALIFQVDNVPIWLNLLVWLFVLALIIMAIEIVRGV